MSDTAQLGQVIIIGATNRPDAVDPALRRPGRFDREFYFPLPNKEARRKILDINTNTWEPKLEDTLLDNLAGLTKGYGGADLRVSFLFIIIGRQNLRLLMFYSAFFLKKQKALCTEASLNAIQRRYPQIYKSKDRLLLQPETIQVQAKDFMTSIKSTSSSIVLKKGSVLKSKRLSLFGLVRPDPFISSINLFGSSRSSCSSGSSFVRPSGPDDRCD